MDLLDRYLAAIARHLPDAQKADVTAELRDVLLSQIEDEEARLGRPLERKELEALLVRFGHPLTVSGRYRKVQHLIGPEVFPFWWAANKATLAIILGIYLVLVMVRVIGGDEIEGIGESSQPSLVATLVFAFGAITLVCALIERFGKTAILTRWKPRELPPAGGKTKSRFERAVEIGMGLVFILWWVGAIRFREFIPETGLRIELAPIWKTLFAPILAYGGFELAVNILGLLRPGFVRLNRSLSLARNLLGLALVSVIYQAGHWVEVSVSLARPDLQARLQTGFDLGMRIGIGLTIVVFAVLAAIDGWRLYQASQETRPSPARPA
jgi:hypothetical protein